MFLPAARSYCCCTCICRELVRTYLHAMRCTCALHTYMHTFYVHMCVMQIHGARLMHSCTSEAYKCEYAYALDFSSTKDFHTFSLARACLRGCGYLHARHASQIQEDVATYATNSSVIQMQRTVATFRIKRGTTIEGSIKRHGESAIRRSGVAHWKSLGKRKYVEVNSWWSSCIHVDLLHVWKEYGAILQMVTCWNCSYGK
jgi:hypothetical protein